jgi:hypothetical protein
MGRICSTHGEMRNPYDILFGKPEGKKQLRRSRHRWQETIKINFKPLRSEGVC